MAGDRSGPTEDGASLDKLIKILWIGIGTALIAIVAAHITYAAHMADVLAGVGIGALIFLASFASGAFIGFLFGVPRVLSSDRVQAPGMASANGTGSPVAAGADGDPAPGSPHAAATATQTRILQSNTNLERISDWLTTLIVGASLTQLYKLNDGLVSFEDFLATHALVFHPAKGAPTAGVLPAVGPIILIFGAVCGFLYMYLSTRLVLIRLFYAIEKFISGGDRLGGDASRTLQSVIRGEDRLGHFVQEQLQQKGRVTVDDALEIMLDLLYKDAPDRVIEIGASLNGSTAPQKPDYWLYMAAAFGQKMAASDHGSNDWMSNRDNALDCARRSVALDPAYRQRLWLISNPDSTDNDLAPLHDDPTFQRIVGQRP